MAAKRPAQLPPPPAAPSEETDSGSSEESEEEVAHSPPPAAIKSMAPPPQKAPADDEEEDESSEEEEEEEEEDAPTVAPIAIKNPPPEEPDTPDKEEEEEEETDDEASQPELAAAKDAEPSAAGDKKPAAPFQRTWSTDDEVRILEALAAYRRDHGTLPQLDALVTALTGSLDNRSRRRVDLQGKVNSMRRRYNTVVRKGAPPSMEHDRRVFDLSKAVWGTDKPNSGATREFGEMCQLYPYLAEEVKALEASHPGLFKRVFTMVDDNKARVINAKIKRQRMGQMKVKLRRHDLTKVVTKVLMDLIH